MQDNVMAEAATKAGKGKGAGVPPGPDAQVARLIIRALWQQDWNAANPGKTAAERTAAWKLVRVERMEADLKKMRRALTLIKKEGVTLAMSKGGAAEAE